MQLEELDLFDKSKHEELEMQESFFGSPGGKHFLASKIIPYFPEHETYVEPFIGGGAILLKKKPSEKEIINDIDLQITNAYSTMKSENPQKIRQAIEAKDWGFDKEKVRRCWASSSKGISGFLDFLYGLRGSFAYDRNSLPGSAKTAINTPPLQIKSGIERFAKRLENVSIHNGDYKKLKKFDSPKTFFYCDPPYPGVWARERKDDVFDLERFVDFLSSLKGKFIVSMSNENRKFFEGKNWHFKTVFQMNCMTPKLEKRVEKREEFIVSNFPLHKNKIYLTESEQLQEFKVRGYDPTKVSDAQLRDDWRLLTAKYANMLDGEKTEFETMDDLKSFAVDMLREILTRGTKVLKFHPEEIQETSLELLRDSLREIVTKRLMLPGRHAQMISNQKKKIIVKSRDFDLGQFSILNDGTKSYGYIRALPSEKGAKGDIALFEKLRELHGITNEEREKWWPGKRVFYFYDIPDFIPFESPVTDRAPHGAQTFWIGAKLKEDFPFDPTSYEPLVIKDISDAELIIRHGELHEIFRQRGERASDELVINAHLFVFNEIKKRGLEHRQIEKLDRTVFSEEKGDEKKPIKLSAISNFFDTDFYLKDPLLALVGGTAVNGEGTDLDMWVNWENPLDDEEKSKASQRFLQQLAFRLKSFLPPEYAERLHIVPEPEGKFTNYMPIAKLKIEFIKPGERKLLKMSLSEQEPRAASPEIFKQFEQSKKEDKIELFRFFLPQKPVRAAEPEQRMTVEKYVSLFKDEDFPVLSSKKYDGMAIEIHVDTDTGKVVIWSEDGEDITDRLPGIAAAVLKLNFENAVLLAELEMWKDGKTHQPREAVAGKVHEKGDPDDSEMVANIFTTVFLNNNDLHKLAETERQKLLETFGIPQSTWDVPDVEKKINLVPNLVSANRNELEKNVEVVSGKVASEGDVGKKAKALYYLDGKSRGGWIKYHKNALLIAKVMERIKTKVPTVFNYRYGIWVAGYDAKKQEGRLAEVGKSFNTEKKIEKGDMIAIEFETLNFTKDLRDDTVGISAWVPRFIPIENLKEKPTKIDDIDTAIEKARKAGVLQLKTISKDGETLYEAKRPVKEYPVNFAILVNHFRGKSVHMDFRRKQDNHLEGETILNQPEGLIDEEVGTLEKGRKWSKVLMEKGKFRPDMDPTKKAVIVAKAKQPLEWLNVRELKIEPGEVGATRFEPGVFITADEGMAYPGVQKEWFREFFLDMKHFKGRMAQRAIGVGKEWEKPPKGVEIQWQAWMTKEQVPYLLTKRGRERHEDVPPDGVSWINPEFEKKIPANLRWWDGNPSRSEKLKMMDDAFNFLIEEGILSGRPLEEAGVAESSARFTLRRHWWMGPKVVRGMAASGSHWDLLIDIGKPGLIEWRLEKNPLTEGESIAKRKIVNTKTPQGKDTKEWLSFEGSIAPNDANLKEVSVVRKVDGGKYIVEDKAGNREETKETFADFQKNQTAWADQWGNIYTGNLKGATYGNINERIPAYINIIDSGQVEIVESTNDFVSLMFKGDELKGYWIFRRESPGSDLWLFEQSELPRTKEDLPGTWTFPEDIKYIKIVYGDRTYTLETTQAGRLRLFK